MPTLENPIILNLQRPTLADPLILDSQNPTLADPQVLNNRGVGTVFMGEGRGLGVMRLGVDTLGAGRDWQSTTEPVILDNTD